MARTGVVLPVREGHCQPRLAALVIAPDLPERPRQVPRKDAAEWSSAVATFDVGFADVGEHQPGRGCEGAQSIERADDGVRAIRLRSARWREAVDDNEGYAKPRSLRGEHSQIV